MPLFSETNKDRLALVVSPKKAAIALDVGLTRIYQLTNSGELQSYHDGKSRKIVVASLEAYIARQIECEVTKERRGWTDRATEVRMAKKRLYPSSRKTPGSSRPAAVDSVVTRLDGPKQRCCDD
jgi:excisionase family DNA binding protein